MRSPAHYRPDIDGVRAVAVLLVLAYHFFPAYWGGGYLGVDIFFVISGFLITGIVWESLEQNRFSLAEFYLRRVRRLFPALLTVLIPCVLVAYWLFIPFEFVELGRTLQAAVSYIPNFYFWQHTGYFDIAVSQQPLMHLWSLGVEEQFYALWPLLLLALWRFRLFPPLLLIPFGAWSLYFAAIRPLGMVDRDFYLPQFHAWEIAAGCLLAFYSRRGVSEEWKEIAAWLGMYLIAAGVACSGLFGPSLWCVVAAVVGASLFIGAGPATSLNQFIGMPGPASVGRRSYSLYLWHWPVFCITQMISTHKAISTNGKWMLVVATFLLTEATYRYLERPVRKRGLAVSVPLIAASLVLFAIGHWMWNGTIQPRSAKFSILPLIEQAHSGAVDCVKNRQIEGSYVCELTSQRSEVLFWGDSNSVQYGPRVGELMKRFPGKVRPASFINGPGCPPIMGVSPARFIGCEPGEKFFTEMVAHPEVKTIVLAAQWINYLDGVSDLGPTVPGGNPDEKQMLLSLESFVKTWRAAGKDVVILLSTPYWPPEPQVLVERNFWKPWKAEGAVYPRAEWDEKHLHVNNELRKHLEPAGARFIDPTPYVCDSNSCPAFTPEGTIIYSDADHLSDEYVREHATFIDELVVNSGVK